MDDTKFLNTLQRLAASAAGDRRLLRLGRACHCEVLMLADGHGAYLGIRAGRIEALVSGPRHLRSHDFALRATGATWEEFWSPRPRPGFHDIFALARFEHAHIDGSLEPLLAHLPYFKRLLSLPREFAR